MSADTRDEFVTVRRDILEDLERSLEDALNFVRDEIKKQESKPQNVGVSTVEGRR